MGSFVINGLADSRGADKIDPRIVDIIRTAAATSPYDVELFSGKRFGSGASRHDHGNAVDIVLRDPNTGKEIPNLGAGGPAFEAYEGFAKTAREAQQARYPELKNSFRWGGYFGPSTKNPNGFDAMHFDIKPGGAMRYGSWNEGLHNRSGGLDAFKKLGAGMTYSSQGQNLGEMPQEAIQTSLIPKPPSREAGLDDDVLHTAALTLLGEAAGEGRKGMEAVGQVVNNRVASDRYPSDPKSVMLQPKQFSAWNEGKGGNSPDKRYSRDEAIYQQARATAADVLSGRVADPLQGGTAYYAPKAMPGGREPYWWDEESKHGSTKIGNHRFALGEGSPPSAVAAIDQMAPIEAEKPPALAYQGPTPPTRPQTLPSAQPARPDIGKAIANNLTLGEKIKYRKAPEVFGAFGDGVTKVASAFGDAGMDLFGKAANSIDGFTAPRPPIKPMGIEQATPLTPLGAFAKIPAPNAALQAATNTKAASMAPPPPIARPQGLDGPLNPFLGARDSIKTSMPGVFNTIHDVGGQIDGFKEQAGNRIRTDLSRAVYGQSGREADRVPSGMIKHTNNYIYERVPEGQGINGGRFRQAGKVTNKNGREKIKIYDREQGPQGVFKRDDKPRKSLLDRLFGR